MNSRKNLKGFFQRSTILSALFVIQIKIITDLLLENVVKSIQYSSSELSRIIQTTAYKESLIPHKLSIKLSTTFLHFQILYDELQRISIWTSTIKPHNQSEIISSCVSYHSIRDFSIYFLGETKTSSKSELV